MGFTLWIPRPAEDVRHALSSAVSHYASPGSRFTLDLLVRPDPNQVAAAERALTRPGLWPDLRGRPASLRIALEPQDGGTIVRAEDTLTLAGVRLTVTADQCDRLSAALWRLADSPLLTSA